MASSTSSSDLALRVLHWHQGGRPKLIPLMSFPEREIHDEPVMCPSQSPADGTVLLGYSRVGDRLDRSVREESNHPEGATPRFAGNCQSDLCPYWNDSCQLAGAIVEQSDGNGSLPRCPIRRNCRWWLEHGPTACGTCDFVAYKVPVEPQ